MINQNLDIFDLRKIQINKTKAELENNGKRQQKEVSSDMLGTFMLVDRDPVKIIQITEANMIPSCFHCATKECLPVAFHFSVALLN
ncbi:hypothetical protein LWM71_10600 [Limosilactobacillus reuteri]|nr:hypothetical protein LWM71_10600 [Limosilactobacillus reuteri]